MKLWDVTMPVSKKLFAWLRAPSTAAAVILTALWALFFWRLFTPSAADRVIFVQGDFPIHYFAHHDYYAEIRRIFQGHLLLWNPYNYAGDPLAANMQWAVWYPLRWLMAVLSGARADYLPAYQWESALHYWLTSVLMYAFLRVLVRRHTPALLGSVLWTYGAYLTGYPMLQPSILEAITWLPLMLLGVHLSVTRTRWRVGGMALAGGALGLSVLAGHPQSNYQAAALSVAYLVYLGWQERLPWRGIAWRALLFGGVGVGLAAVQVLPTLEMYRYSYRSEAYHYVDKANGFTFAELVQIVWPRLFGATFWPLYPSVIGLLLVARAVWRAQRTAWFWIGVVVVGMWLALGGNSFAYDAVYVLLPGGDLFRGQERIAALITFAVAVLAAYELRDLLAAEMSEDGQRRLRLLARGHLALSLGAYVLYTGLVLSRTGDPKDVTANALGVVALLSVFFNGWLAWRARWRGTLTVWALGALLVLDLFSLGAHSANFVPDTRANRPRPPDFAELLSQDVDEMTFHVDGAAGLQARGSYWRIPDIYGVVPLRLASIEKLRQIRVDRRWEVLAVRYVSTSAKMPENVPVTVLGDGVNYDGVPYTLYELDDPRPFAHLVYQVRVSENGAKGARAIMTEPWIDLREIGVVQRPLPFELPNERPPDARVEAFHMLQPEYMEMRVSTSAPALLTVAVPNYPGWEVRVNGQRTPIVDVYAGLIGVPISPGENQLVVLQFRPRSVLVGGIISALTLLGLLCGAAVALWRHKGAAHG